MKNYIAFKKGNWPEDHGQLTRSWGRFSSVVEAVSIAWLCGFKSAGKELEFRFKKATNFGTIGPRSGRDWATIGPRSGHNRRLGRSSVGVRSSGGDSAAEAPRSRLDRAAILEFLRNPSMPSARSLGDWRVTIARSRSTLLVLPMAIQPF